MVVSVFMNVSAWPWAFFQGIRCEGPNCPEGMFTIWTRLGILGTANRRPEGTKVTGVTPEACAASNLGRIGYRLLLQTGPGSQVAVCQSLTLRSIMPAKGQLPPAARLYQQDAHLVEQGPEMVEAAGVEPASLANEPAATTCLVREMFSSGR